MRVGALALLCTAACAGSSAQTESRAPTATPRVTSPPIASPAAQPAPQGTSEDDAPPTAPEDAAPASDPDDLAVQPEPAEPQACGGLEVQRVMAHDLYENSAFFDQVCTREHCSEPAFASNLHYYDAALGERPPVSGCFVEFEYPITPKRSSSSTGNSRTKRSSTAATVSISIPNIKPKAATICSA